MTAPSSLTYQQASKAAAAIHAAGASPLDPVATVANMAEQIIAARDKSAAWAKTAVRQLWATVDPYDPKQVRAFAEQAAALLDSAQTAAGRVAAAGQAQQLAAAGIDVAAAPSLPLNVRGSGAAVKNGQLVLQHGASTVDYVGADAGAKVSRADMTTQGVFTRPAAVFRYAQSIGATDAAAQAVARIDSLVDDNLMLAQRLAQQQALVQAVVDLDTGRTRNGTKIIGYRRLIHPELSRGGTCGMCIAASDRIYHVAQLLPIHALCKCTIAAVTEDYDPADDLNSVDLSQLYKDAGGTSNPHLKRTRYVVDEHGELGPVLAPKGKYKPRTTKSKVRVGGTALLTDQPAQADVAKHQIGVLKENLAKMRAEGVPEDSSKIAYHQQLIAKLQRQADGAAGGGGGGGGGGNLPPTGGGGSDGDDPSGRLNALFAQQSGAAQPDQRVSAQRWQRRDRYYEQVQTAVVDSDNATDEAAEVAADLHALAVPLPEDVVVWRGIRSIQDTFGTSLEQVSGRTDEIVNRFMATTVHEQVARDEFIRPGRNPAMLKVTARAGVSAVWMPPIGDPELAEQGELLFTPGHLLRILSVDTSGDVPVIEVEVSRP